MHLLIHVLAGMKNKFKTVDNQFLIFHSGQTSRKILPSMKGV